jgi:NitT/TauT family transport system ATP-binding protein
MMTRRAETAADCVSKEASSPMTTRQRRARQLELREISKTFRSVDGTSIEAIRRVSCDIEQGEFISILGPSGCGKSTLLMIVAGLVAPTSGHVVAHGETVSGLHPDFGIVFQDAVLFPWRTVLANVELPGEITKMPVGERTARARELLRLVKLEGFEGKYPHELSGGMQQRVAIARALMLSPSLMLMDEPFGALDALTREEMNLELQRISLESGQTILFVTHSIPEAAFLSDRVLVMSGRPSTVVEIVSIDNPRPRAIDMLVSDRFGRYVSHMRNLLGRTEAPL